MSEHMPTPWRYEFKEVVSKHGLLIADVFIPEEGPLLAAALDLLEACQLALKYHRAIESCANDPKKLTEYGTAQGDNLDSLYMAWITAVQAAIAKATKQE